MKIKYATMSVLATGMVTSATAASYLQNFDGFADGTTDLGDGSVIASHFDNADNGVARASVQGGELRITEDDVNSQRASFRVPAVANSSLGWTATFDYTLFDAAGGNSPADGFSFNYGNILPLTETRAGENGHGNAEAGMGGSVIAFAIDTWQDGGQGYNIHGANDVNRITGSVLADGGTVNGTATITWNPSTTSFSTTGSPDNANFAGVEHSFAGDDSYGFAFSARTGGANEEFRIDNLVITTVPEPSGAMLIALSSFGFLLRRRR